MFVETFLVISGFCSSQVLIYQIPDCNICHAPKFGKIEERTGAGGGFNERGKVEYKENVESDGEYDDVSMLAILYFD